MVEICAVASGSNGNCYYIGNHENAILVDAGVNCKQILSKMKLSGLSPSKLRGIFITHEHNDHVCGVRVLAKKLDIPVFMTKGTYQGLYLTNRPDAVRLIESDQSIDLCSFIIHPVLKNHDGKEPTSFRVEHKGINIGVFTDIGSPCDNVTAHLKVCDALFLESNYDEKMLWDGSYPPHLKERVASDVGHLSNLQAAELLEEHAAEHLKVVLLSHLSGENNTPEIAYQAVKHLEDRFQIIVTSRKQPSEVITVVKRVN
ncbi:MAG: MBL fold metallo-hydrolase [Bacteroidia bacterium]|nr:MBL fold metallo-hydrolase [Bacteroidia bacterium]